MDVVPEVEVVAVAMAVRVEKAVVEKAVAEKVGVVVPKATIFKTYGANSVLSLIL